MNTVRLCKIFSPFFLIIVWYGVALAVNATLILPFPHEVLFRLISLSQSSNFWLAFLFTFFRVIIAFVLSLLIGFFTGLFSADYPYFKALIQFPLALIRVTPIIAFILIALFWFKSDSVPVFTALLMSLPVVISASEKGFEKNPENQEKLFKAKSRGVTGFTAFRYVRFPCALPALLSGAESSFGLCWKVVAAGEVLSLPHFAAGSLMQTSQVHLETADTLAVTSALVIISYACQCLLRFFCFGKISSKNHKKAL